jgi:hypothetical protein
VKLVATFFLCFLLSACAGIPKSEPPRTPLPDAFLGRWYYGNPYDIKFDISNNGSIIESNISDGKLRERKDFKVAYIENPNSAYLIVRTDRGEVVYGYVHFTTQYAKDPQKPNRFEMWYDCIAKSDDEWNWKPEQFKRRVLFPTEDECVLQDMYGAEYYYRDQ